MACGDWTIYSSQNPHPEKPDVFHDLFGHVPLLFNPIFADHMQAEGTGRPKTHGPGRASNCRACTGIQVTTPDFTPLYAQLQSRSELSADALLPEDVVIQH